MPPPILTLEDIAWGFGATRLLDGAALSVAPGERLALVGRNGSGKSTLLKIAAGLIEPERGRRFVQPGTALRYLPQEPDPTTHPTIGAYVEAGLAPGEAPNRARRLMGELGLDAAAATRGLSGGEAKRAALARALGADPDVLLLDEPTNHLDLPAIEWLQATLAASRAALVLISHDRRLLAALSRATLWLDRGRARRIERGFGAFETWRDEVLEQEEREAHKLTRQIAREEHWLRHGVSARRKRNMRRVGELAALRERRRQRIRPTGAARLEATAQEGGGSLVIAAEGVTKSLGGRALVAGFSTRILRGDRIGIVGPNGAGKTTLLNLLTGALAPDSGEVRLGTGLAMITLDQKREALDPEATLAATLTGGGDVVHLPAGPRHVHGYMQDFLFPAEQARTPVSALSGGERARLLLARALARRANLLVLDEPTNDLDVETLDLLEEVLATHPGTVLVVSHDRDFLDRVATGVIAWEGEGVWRDYPGGYADMVAQRGAGVLARTAPAAVAPKREAAAAAPPARRKLGFRESHALATLPARIEALAAEIVRHQAALADPSLYAREPARFQKLGEALAAAEAARAAAEEEWLRLEILREEIEAGG